MSFRGNSWKGVPINPLCLVVYQGHHIFVKDIPVDNLSFKKTTLTFSSKGGYTAILLTQMLIHLFNE